MRRKEVPEGRGEGGRHFWSGQASPSKQLKGVCGAVSSGHCFLLEVALSLVPDHVPTKLVFRCFSSSGRFEHGKTDFTLKLNGFFVHFFRDSLCDHLSHRFHSIRNDSPTCFGHFQHKFHYFCSFKPRNNTLTDNFSFRAGVSLWATKLLLTCSRAPHEPNSRLTGTVLRTKRKNHPQKKRTGNRLLEKGGHLFRHVVTFNRNAREWKSTHGNCGNVTRNVSIPTE